jgi:chemotaxis signal transduction protein
MENFTPLQLKHYLAFTVANEKFAIDILDIDSIHTSAGKDGFDDIEDLKTAVRLHKRVIPIINMQKKLRLKGSLPEQPSLIFLKVKEENTTSLVGLQVDQLLEIVEIMVPRKPDKKNPRLIKAMIGLQQEIIMVLRAKDVVSSEELIQSENQVPN